MQLTERRRYPRWRSDGARVLLHVRGEKTQRGRVRCVSRSGLFIETDYFLRKGRRVELAFVRSYTQQVVKVFRRSAFVIRCTEDGVAVRFFEKREVLT